MSQPDDVLPGAIGSIHLDTFTAQGPDNEHGQTILYSGGHESHDHDHEDASFHTGIHAAAAEVDHISDEIDNLHLHQSTLYNQTTLGEYDQPINSTSTAHVSQSFNDRLYAYESNKKVPTAACYNVDLDAGEQEKRLQKKQTGFPEIRPHAFGSIWDGGNRPAAAAAGHKTQVENKCLPCIPNPSWRQWPPKLPHVPDGLKIPVELKTANQTEQNSGLDLGLGFNFNNMEAHPIKEGPEEMFASLKGILNRPEAVSCTATPSQILFIDTEVGHHYFVKVKIKNRSKIPRKIGVLRPSHKYLDISWGAELNESTMISPGLSAKVVVDFKPKSDELIHDILTIIVHDDGNIVIPIVTTSISPPVLEVEEWDCGCSIVGQPRISTFEIVNYGGSGRFWLKTEEEFKQDGSPVQGQVLQEAEINLQINDQQIEALEYKGEVEIVGEGKGKVETIAMNKTGGSEFNGEETEGEKDEEVEGEDEIPKPEIKTMEYNGEESEYKGEGNESEFNENFILMNNFDEEDHNNNAADAQKPRVMKMDHLYMKPFEIVPACFRLRKNHKIKIVTRYRPMQPGFHYKKIGILCDNGEVRWIAIKGVGLDAENQPLVNVESEWTGPPCDLRNHTPSDNGTKFAIDCGDLLPNQIGQPSMTLTNTSCIPVYFFWSIRPAQSCCDVGAGDTLLLPQTPSTASMNLVSYLEEMEAPGEWRNPYKDEPSASNPFTAEPLRIRIHPAQGILEPFQDLHSHLVVEALGQESQERCYHGCVISLFVQQLEDRGIKKHLAHKLTKYTKEEVIDIPISFVRLMQDMPKTMYYYSSEETGDEDETGTGEAGGGNQDPSSSSKATAAAVASFSPDPLLYLKLNKTSDDVNSKEFSLRKLGHSKNDRGRTLRRRQCKDKEKHQMSGSAGDGYRLMGKEKQWMYSNNTDSFLCPTFECEVWARSLPVQCWFDPQSFEGTGYPHEQLERIFICTNQSKYPIKVVWDGFLNEHCSVSVEPMEFEVDPEHTQQFNVVSTLCNSGKVSGSILGQLKLPFITIACEIPLKLEIHGAMIESMTSLVHFGIVKQGTETCRTFAIKNTGIHKVTWRAQISDMDPTDENGNLLPLHPPQFDAKQLLKIWPEWGALEPNEMAGSQLFLSTDVIGKIVTTIEIQADQNPTLILYIPVFGEIQSPVLILENTQINLENMTTGVLSDNTTVTLRNPTTFPAEFLWCNPIDFQNSLFRHVKLEPKSGVVAPGQSVTSKLILFASKPCILNLVIPCCVDGMNEPLLLQISVIVRPPPPRRKSYKFTRKNRVENGPKPIAAAALKKSWNN